MKHFFTCNSTTSRRFLQLFFICACTNVCSGRRPIDTEESKHATKLQKVVSGIASVTDLIFSFIDPSKIIDTNAKFIHPTTIQVQFAGLGRTGTTSLASAMTILGYKVLHDDEAPAVIDLYNANYNGRISDDELHFQIGQRGFNCSFLYHDYEWAASAEQSNVKVILNGRDDNPEKWVDSWLTVASFYHLLASRPFIWIPSIQDLLPLLHISMVDIPTGGRPEMYLDRDTLLKGYQKHYDTVRSIVPEDRLLEYNVKEGWGPLCKFLNLPIPDVPFPHINDRFKVQVTIWSLTIITWIWPILIILPLFVIFKLTAYISTRQSQKHTTKYKSS